MTDHLLEAYRVDFMTRTNPETGSGGQVAEGHGVHAHEVRAGVVYKDDNVTVTPFRRNMRWKVTGIDSTRPIAAL